MPEWLGPLVAQLPLVAAVAWAFVTGRVHSKAELERREQEHLDELRRQKIDSDGQVADWKRLYEQERGDRIEAHQKLAAAIDSIGKIVDGVEDLTREVIRNAGR